MKSKLMKAFLATMILILLLMGCSDVASADNLDGSLVTTGDAIWYTGLGRGNWRNEGAHSTGETGKVVIPGAVRDPDVRTVQWSIEFVSGINQFQLNDRPFAATPDSCFEATLKPKNDTLQAGKSVYKITGIYNGVTYTGTQKVTTVIGASLPTELNVRAFMTDSAGSVIGSEIPIVDGVLTVKKGDYFYLNANMNMSYPGINASELFMNTTYNMDAIRTEGDWGGAADPTAGIYPMNTRLIKALTIGDTAVQPWMDPSDSNFMIASPIIVRVTGGQTAVEPVLMGDYPWTDGNLDVIDFPVYIGLPLWGNVRQWDSVVKVFVYNYEEMEQAYGDVPSWTVTRTDNGTDALNYSWKVDDLFGEGGRAIGSLNSMPSKPMTAELTVTCTWGGKTASKVIRVEAVQLEDYPTGLLDLPDVIDTQVGATLMLTPKLAPAGWNKNGYTPRIFVANGLMEFADLISGTETGTSTVRKAGTYEDTVGLLAGTVFVVKPVTFRVAEGQGLDPTLTLRNSNDSINRYLGMTNAYEAQHGVFSWNALAGAEIENFDQLASQFSGDPVWDVRQMSGESLPFTWTVENDGRMVDVRLEAQNLVDANYQPNTVDIRISCTWGGQTDYVETTVHLDYPPNGLPTGIDYNNGSNVVECMVGDKLYITPSILPSSWGGIPGYQPEYAGNSGEFEEFCKVDRDWKGGRELTVTKAGTYQCFVGVGIDTITAGRWITYRVKPAIRTDGYFWFGDQIELENTATYYVADDLELDLDEEDTLFSLSGLFSYQLNNPEDFADILAVQDPIFSVTLKEGNVKYEVMSFPEDYYLDVRLKEMPKAGTSATFTVSCLLDGQTASQDVSIQFKALPSRPTGVVVDQSNPLVLKVGDAFEFYPPIQFADGWMLHGQLMQQYGSWDVNFWDAIDWKSCTADVPGVYDIELCATSWNVSMIKRCKLIITEADGTLDDSLYRPSGTVAIVPGGLKTIESEAFAGTKFTEVDIPAGVSIAVDAFDGTGLIAVYTHNDPDTIAWAVNNGFVAVTE